MSPFPLSATDEYRALISIVAWEEIRKIQRTYEFQSCGSDIGEG